MSDTKPTDSQKQSDQGGLDSSVFAKTTDQTQIPSAEETTCATQQQVTQPMTQSWRGWEYMKQGWTTVKSPESTNLIMAVATVVIAIFTALTFWLVLGGSQDTRRLITTAETQARAADEISSAADDFTDSAYWMEQHMDDAASAMQDSVDTASENTRVTIKNAQIAFRDEQRAWVGVESIKLTKFEPGKSPRVEVILFNSGKTPAIKTHASSGYLLSPTAVSEPSPLLIQVMEQELPVNPRNSVPPQGRLNDIVGDIGEQGQLGQSLASQHESGIAKVIANYDHIVGKELILYFYGEFQYLDINKRSHTTQFCAFLAKPETKEMQFCEGFNELN